MPHYYKLYENYAELIKIVSFFIKEGLDKGEYCFWVVPVRFDKHDALRYLSGYIRLIDYYKKIGQIEIVEAAEWYIPGGSFDIDATLEKWKTLYGETKLKGFKGLRVVGGASWAREDDWKLLIEYESKVNEVLKGYDDFTALCVYNISGVKSIIQISQIVNNHQDCFVSE